MDKTSLYAYILFDGNDDFPLDVVTERLDVQPTETWKVGERVNPNHPINQKLRSCTGWRFKIDAKESLDTEDVLRPLLEVFQTKTDTINQLKEELNLDVYLALVIHIYDGYTPGFAVYPEFGKFTSEINTLLDVDMYVSSFNEPDE